MAVQISHVGLAVADLEASTRFYVEGLGFEATMCFENGDEVAAVAEVSTPVEMKAQNLEKDGFRVQLMAWASPGLDGAASASRNQPGLTHFAVMVDDLDATIERLTELGGTSLGATRTQLVKGPMTITLAVVTDPDGTRIELLHRA